MSPVIRFNEATDIVLLRLYLLAMRDINEGIIWEDDLPIKKPAGISATVAKKALADLVERELVETEYHSDSGDDWYQITHRGLTYIDKQIEDITSYVYKNFTTETAWVESLSEQKDIDGDDDDEAVPNIPAADRLVALDHNSAIYNKAIENLEGVITAVNDDRTNDFEDKEQILAELNAGKTLLQSLKVRTGTIVTVLGTALTTPATKFADDVIGNLAAAAWTAIKTLVGL